MCEMTVDDAKRLAAATRSLIPVALNVYAVDQQGSVTINYKDDVPWVIFRATSQDKGDLFLEVYLALSLENRRKLVEAVK
jgi:hypothetical protein